MTRPIRLLVLIALLLPLLHPWAAAQQRSIPEEAKRGVIRHVSGPIVTIDGKDARLAPGATIRNRENLFIVPIALPPDGALAEYLVNPDGQISRVWLLTPEEAAQSGPPARR